VFLAGGPILALQLELPDAAKRRTDAWREWCKLLGPDSPADWPRLPKTLRGMYGADLPRLVALAPVHKADAAREVVFFWGEGGPAASDASDAGGDSGSLRSSAVDMSALESFCFPPGEQYPLSAGRLFVFGRYGPLAADGHLRSGIRGEHVVSHTELKVMVEELTREDLLQVYVGNACLQRDEQDEVIKAADSKQKAAFRYSREELRALFAHLPRTEGGRVAFSSLQDVIRKERARRVASMKVMYPALTSKVAAAGHGGKPQGGARAGAGAGGGGRRQPSPSLFTSSLRPRKIDDTEAFLVNHELLNRHAYKICNVEDGSLPALTQNVRLLLDDRNCPAPDPSKPRWQQWSHPRAEHEQIVRIAPLPPAHAPPH
jgi:hypothetical protein